MKAFIVGGTGYVGSAVARVLQRRGASVAALSRSEKNARALEAAGIEPVFGDIADPAGLTKHARNYELVIYAAMIPFRAEATIIRALLEGVRGASRSLLLTSGTGVLSIPNFEGEWDEHSFAEDDVVAQRPLADSLTRIATEDLVRASSGDGFRGMVVRPPLIWGNGGSIQIPRMFDSARRTGAVCYLGRGLNLYSHVHVDDLAEVFALAVERGTGGALYHAVAGEVNFRTIAEAIATVIGCETRSLVYTDACALWGKDWTDLAMAVNSRSRAPRTRVELGWAPHHLDLIEDIRNGSYREVWEARRGWAAGLFDWAGAHGQTAA